MKTRLLSAAIAALLIATASAAPPVPPVVDFADKRYIAAPVEYGPLALRELVLVRVGDEFRVAQVGADRGNGVYRMLGSDTQFITAANFAARLIDAEALAKESARIAALAKAAAKKATP